MSKQFIKKYLPSHDSVRSNRYIKVFGSTLHHHNLWHLHRRSVAGGVAIGLFTGLIPGPFQMLSAAILAVVFRVNLPVAVVVTWYTNPFTIVPLYYAAYKIGAFFLGHDGRPAPARHINFTDLSISEWFPAFINWVTSLGKPLAIGLPILAAALAICGYIFVRLLWRLRATYKWRDRKLSKKTA